MPITEHQRKQRQKHIGSSDAAAILGISPYSTPYDIWLQKTGRAESAFKGSEAADIGNMCENAILDWAAEEAGLKIRKNQYRVHAGGVLASNHDALAVADRIGFEAKTSGIVSLWSAKDQWGDSGTDKVPDHILIQCVQQMIVSDLTRVYVPALIGGRGRALFVIDRDPAIVDMVGSRLADWWEAHVVRDTPPEGIPTLDMAKAIKREEGKETDLDYDLVNAWQHAKAQEKKAQKAKDDALCAILAAMGDADTGNTLLGAVLVKEIQVKRLDQTALKKAHPEIYKQFVTPTAQRRVSFKEAK